MYPSYCYSPVCYEIINNTNRPKRYSSHQRSEKVLPYHHSSTDISSDNSSDSNFSYYSHQERFGDLKSSCSQNRVLYADIIQFV